MKKLSLALLSALFLSFLLVDRALACTTFCLKSGGEVLFGRNYDWDIGDALVFVNKRGVAKQATVADSPNLAKWVSKYGSVTFNQYGRENPTGGMNEAGLVVEQMWLDETEYSKDAALPATGTQEWIEYILDNSATVEEAVRYARRVRIVSEVKVHYLVSDKTGAAASFEFLGGQLVVHAGERLPFSTLTNDTYEKSLSYLKATPAAKATTEGSLDRFVRAALKTQNFGKQTRDERESVNYTFEVLTSVAQEGGTQWSIVYDQKRGKIYFRTLESPQLKMIDAKAFDYSCATPLKIFDINSKESGDVTAKFTNYTPKANRDLIERSFNGTSFLKDLPAPIRDFVASYPESFTCGLSSQKARPKPSLPSSRQRQAHGQSAGRVKARAAARFASGTSALNIPLDIDNNIIRLNVSVNGSKPLKFIFDTGASISAINQPRAAELGLKAKGQVRGLGTGGKIQAALIQGVSLSVQGAQVSNQLMATMPFNTPPGFEFDGVIGYDFIKQFVIEIDYRNKTMSLYDPRAYAYSGKGEVIPVILSGRRTPLALTKIILEGRAPVEARLEVDTGADGTFVINSPFARRQRLVEALQKTTQDTRNGAGGEEKVLVGQLKAVQLGRITLNNPPVALSQDTEGSGASEDNDGVIGGEIFRRFKVILDYSRGRMILEPNESFNEPYHLESDGE